MTGFTTPATWLAGIDAEATARLLAAAADLAVVVDADGTVRDVACPNAGLATAFAGFAAWPGQKWRDCVATDSRQKVDEMMRDAARGVAAAPRQVNYPGQAAVEVPIVFSVQPVGARIIALGRDLRVMASLQQRVADVQQSFERDYARMRHIETRYRILSQMTPEPVLIVDMQDLKVIEANAAAHQRFDGKGKTVGRTLAALIAPEGEAAVATLVADVRARGRADDVKLRLQGDDEDAAAAAFLFRQGSAQLMLLRLGTGVAAPVALPAAKAKLLQLAERVPDGFVVTDANGIIVAANEAFLEMAQLRGEIQAQGQPLDRWLGRAGVDLGVLLNNLRQHGVVRLFASTLRDEFGTESEVEISAGAAGGLGEAHYGFAIRGVGRRAAAPVAPSRAFPKSLEQIIELIGRVSLKDLVREATDVIERLSIEAALTMTGDNRASAAEVLGVSRQSLYVKMRRHGLIEAESMGNE